METMTPFRPQAKVLADSTFEGHRLTTIQFTTWYSIVLEFNTHRMFSRNGASSRARKFSDILEQVKTEPCFPLEWQIEAKGMQGSTIAEGDFTEAMESAWKVAIARAVDVAEYMHERGVHKQIVNQLLAPFMSTIVVVSGTNKAYDNFFKLRCHPAAKPEMRLTAEVIRAVYVSSTPRKLSNGDWHLPYAVESDKDLSLPTRVKACVARCAKVSYGEPKADLSRDLRLYEKLKTNGHLSPFEHVARVVKHSSYLAEFYGNFFGTPWLQHRKEIEAEIDGTDILRSLQSAI